MVEIRADDQNAWQDWSTGRVMASITGMLPSDVLAVRDGMQVHLAARELVTGDIVSNAFNPVRSLS
jgi:sodium/potassium-transporting ATPase subunit alpha